MTPVPTSFRLPEHTKRQLDELGRKFGMTLTQVLVLAVDRLARQELESAEGRKDRKTLTE